MKKILTAFFLVGTVGSASAAIPTFNATCPGNLAVHANAGGPLYLNGKEAHLKKFSDNYFEVSNAGVTVSLSVNSDGSVAVSYTGKHKAHGICEVTTK